MFTVGSSCQYLRRSREDSEVLGGMKASPGFVIQRPVRLMGQHTWAVPDIRSILNVIPVVENCCHAFALCILKFVNRRSCCSGPAKSIIHYSSRVDQISTRLVQSCRLGHIVSKEKAETVRLNRSHMVSFLSLSYLFDCSLTLPISSFSKDSSKTQHYGIK